MKLQQILLTAALLLLCTAGLTGCRKEPYDFSPEGMTEQVLQQEEELLELLEEAERENPPPQVHFRETLRRITGEYVP